jgi:hypothetical protein
MGMVVTIFLGGLALYAMAGLGTGLAFVVSGVTAVQPAPVTAGARVMLLPGAIALWPFVLARWLKSGSSK